MKHFSAIYITIGLFLLAGINVRAQDRDSTQTIESIPADTTQNADPKSDVAQKLPPVVPWQQALNFAAGEIANDSLLRWQIWPDWGDFHAYRRNVISFRQGTIGRLDAFHINGYMPEEQVVRMEGINLGNPLNGLVNYNFVPQRKILRASEQQFGSYYSNIQLINYYINKPVSYLNYDESKHDYRNLEFMVTQNFSRNTNLELSYLDRRDGGNFPNNTIEGSQVMGRAYHFLSPEYQIRALYLRNQVKRDEPFGYVIGNPKTFGFDRFRSQPNSTSGTSDVTRWDLKTGIYHRTDTTSSEDTGLEILLSKFRRNHSYSSDTLSSEILNTGFRLFRNQEAGPLSIRAEAEALWYSASDITPLQVSSWSELKMSADLLLPLIAGNSLFGTFKSQRRAGELGFEFGGGIQGKAGALLSYRAGVFQFDKVPTVQSMYWESADYSGEYLGHETGSTVNGRLDLNLGLFSLGGSGKYSIINNPSILSSEGTFTGGDDYSILSGTAYASFQNHRFEIDASGTYQEYGNREVAGFSSGQPLGDILWIRNSFFVKGYAFDRAAYVKLGLKSLLSPLPYKSRTYNVPLNYWQRNSDYEELPAFFRLDAELSARVRAIMVVLRWENALDGLGQAGYFEAAGYPMPPRRLIIGIRARFVN